MAKSIIPHFQNDRGVPRIAIGVREFKCMGASEPHHHPQIFLDMGEDDELVCPYCSTLFKHDPALSADETVPEGCLVTNAG